MKCSSLEHSVVIITEGNEVPLALMPGLLGLIPRRGLRGVCTGGVIADECMTGS